MGLKKLGLIGSTQKKKKIYRIQSLPVNLVHKKFEILLEKRNIINNWYSNDQIVNNR